jgi:hypothetical protein
VARARARIRDGELRITLPKIADRRGRALRIAVSIDDSGTPDTPLS